MTPPRRTSARLTAPHGFFGRRGGTSTGIFSSLNGSYASGDERGAVEENRGRIAVALGADHVLSAKQVHGNRAILIEDPFSQDQRPEADALVARTPGLAVAVLTADCVPILFEGGDLVAAAHAGWRGSLGGIVEATVALMQKEGAARSTIRAAIGPSLRPPVFDVRADLRSAVLDACPDAEPLFEKTDAEHWQYDHIGFVRQRLAAAGIEEARIDDVGGNTLAEPEAFFSYRGAQRRGEAQFGHNVSAIASGASPRH